MIALHLEGRLLISSFVLFCCFWGVGFYEFTYLLFELSLLMVDGGSFEEVVWSMLSSLPNLRTIIDISMSRVRNSRRLSDAFAWRSVDGIDVTNFRFLENRQFEHFFLEAIFLIFIVVVNIGKDTRLLV